MDSYNSSDRTAAASSFLAAASGRLGWRRSLADTLYSLWLGFLLLAIVAAGFSLSYFAYARFLSHGSTTSVETYGD